MHAKCNPVVRAANDVFQVNAQVVNSSPLVLENGLSWHALPVNNSEED